MDIFGGGGGGRAGIIQATSQSDDMNDWTHGMIPLLLSLLPSLSHRPSVDSSQYYSRSPLAACLNCLESRNMHPLLCNLSVMSLRVSIHRLGNDGIRYLLVSYLFVAREKFICETHLSYDHD